MQKNKKIKSKLEEKCKSEYFGVYGSSTIIRFFISSIVSDE